VGYVVGMVVMGFVPEGAAACGLPPERMPPGDESETASGSTPHSES